MKSAGESSGGDDPSTLSERKDLSPSARDPLTDMLADCDELIAAGDSLEDASASETDDELGAKLAVLRQLDKLRPSRSEATPDQAADSSWRHGDPTRIGRFLIRRKLGHGGFGVVYLAYDPRLRRQVALKIPHPRTILTAELRERFQLEAAAAAGLDHRNIVHVHESGSAGPIHYIAAAYCPGISLANWMREQRDPVPARAAASLTAQIADGVQHAHERGILHRDLKPGNILLTPMRGGKPIEESATVELVGAMPLDGFEFLPRITDFGMAKRVGEWESDGGINEDPSAPLTKTGAVMGTPSHMAPEQAAGRTKDIGPATDVHGLGIILYELLTGQTPFLAESTFDTLRRVQYDEPLSPRKLRPKLPRDLETICLKCLQKEPKRRYQTAGELADDLRAFIDGKTIKARSVGPIEKAWRWSVREPVVAGLLVSLALVVSTAIGALYYLWSDAADKAAIAINERNTAVRARERAEAFELQARNLIGELSQTVGRISNLPAFAKTRQEFAEKLLAFQEGFLKQNPDTPRDLYATATAALTAGRVRSDIGQKDEALQGVERATELFEKLLRLKPEVPQYREQYAWACFWRAKQLEVQEGKADEVFEHFSKGIEKIKGLLQEFPDTPAYQSALAVFLANLALNRQALGYAKEAEADVAEAIRLGRIVLAKEPNHDWNRLNLAMYLDEQSLFDRSRRDVAKAVEHSEEAIALMRPVVAKTSAPIDSRWYFSRYLNSLAGHHGELGNLQKREALRREAIAVLNEIVELQPDFVHFRESLALTYWSLATENRDPARRSEAIEDCREVVKHQGKLLEAFPQVEKYRSGLADARELMGRYTKDTDPAAAVAEYASALQVSPKHVLAMNNLAWILLTSTDPKIRDYPKALELASQANTLGPDTPWCLNTLAVANYRNGRNAEALEILERVVKLRKAATLVDEVFLAMVHKKLGNDGKAKAFHESFLNRFKQLKSPDNETLRFKQEADELFAGPPKA